MPQPINRVPPGLLSLLDVKAMGQNPSLLADTVQPVLGMTELYLGAFSINVFAPSAAAMGAVGTVFLLGGPIRAEAGEVLIVESVGAYPSAALGAGTTVGFCVTVTRTIDGVPFKRLSDVVVGTAGQIPFAGANGLFVVPAGFEVALACTQITLGIAPTINVAARYVRLRI